MITGMTAHGRSLSHVGRPPGANPEIPSSHSPDSRFGRETGRESPFPDSAGIKGTFVHFEAEQEASDGYRSNRFVTSA